MRERGERTESRAWATPAFWAGVEAEIARVDPEELQRFMTADELRLAIRPGFEAELWVDLQRRWLA